MLRDPEEQAAIHAKYAWLRAEHTRRIDSLIAYMRLSDRDRQNLQEALDEVVCALLSLLSREFGAIAMREFDTEVLDSIVDNFAKRISLTVNSARSSEALADARRSHATMLTAMVAGSKIAREDPAQGVGIERAFGGVAEATIKSVDLEDAAEVFAQAVKDPEP